MEPRTRILFISYIVIVLAIVAIGVVPYCLHGGIELPAPQTRPAAFERQIKRPDHLERPAQQEKKDDDRIVGKIRVIGTNPLTQSVRFQILKDGVFFEEQNAHLYQLMKDKDGRDILLTYQKKMTENGALYNFSQSRIVR